MVQDRSIRVVIWDASTVIQGTDRHLSPNLGNFIRALRPVYTTVLFSHTWQELRQALVERWDILDAFDRAILAAPGDEHSVASVFALAVQALSVQPSEAVIVDTHGHRIDVAQDAGLHTVHFSSPAQTGTELFNLLAVSEYNPGVQG